MVQVYIYLTSIYIYVRVCMCRVDGTVLLGDKKGNVFRWAVPEPRSKIIKLPGCCRDHEIVCMASCPYAFQLVAIGYKNGDVVVFEWMEDKPINVLHEHKQEIHCLAWCPFEGSCGKGDSTMLGSSNAESEVFTSTLLASSSMDSIINIHKINFDRSEEKTRILGIENLASFQQPIGERIETSKRLWLSLCWFCQKRKTTAKERNIHLLSSGPNGRIYVWDVAGMLQSSPPSPVAKLPALHSRAVFSVHARQVSIDEVVVCSIGLDRYAGCWRLIYPIDPSVRLDLWSGVQAPLSCLGLGAHPSCLSVGSRQEHVEVDSFLLAVGCGNSTIRLCRCRTDNPYLHDELQYFFWKDIPGAVTSISLNPTNELIAFGCDDGSVGLINCKTRKMILGVARHPMPVVALCWLHMHPDGHVFASFSLEGGTSLFWPGWESFISGMTEKIHSKTIQVIESSSTSIGTGERDDSQSLASLQTTRVSRGMEARDYLLVAQVNGCIGVLDPHDMSFVWTYQHHNVPLAMAVGAGDRHVACLFSNSDIRIVTKGAETATKAVIQQSVGQEPLKITALCLYEYETLGVLFLIVGLESGAIALYCCQLSGTSFALVEVLKGHNAPILGLAFMNETNHDCNFISSSQDQSVRLWRIPASLATKKRTEHMQRKIESPFVQRDNLTNGNDDNKTKGTWSMENELKSKVSTALKSLLPAMPSHTDAIPDSNAMQLKQDMISLLQDGMSRRTGSAPVEMNPDLAQYLRTRGLPVPEHIAHSFLCETSESLATAAATIRGHGDMKSQRRTLAQRSAALKLWQGDVGGAIQVLLENQALTADFVSIAASAGREAWVAVVKAFVAQLKKAGDVHLAVLHLLSIGEDISACLMYEEFKMIRDAVLLASERLPPEHSVNIRLKRAYAMQLEEQGDLVGACAVLGLDVSVGDTSSALDLLLKEHEIQQK